MFHCVHYSTYLMECRINVLEGNPKDKMAAAHPAEEFYRITWTKTWSICWKEDAQLTRTSEKKDSGTNLAEQTAGSSLVQLDGILTATQGQPQDIPTEFNFATPACGEKGQKKPDCPMNVHFFLMWGERSKGTKNAVHLFLSKVEGDWFALTINAGSAILANIFVNLVMIGSPLAKALASWSGTILGGFCGFWKPLSWGCTALESQENCTVHACAGSTKTSIMENPYLSSIVACVHKVNNKENLVRHNSS